MKQTLKQGYVAIPNSIRALSETIGITSRSYSYSKWIKERFRWKIYVIAVNETLDVNYTQHIHSSVDIAIRDVNCKPCCNNKIINDNCTTSIDRYIIYFYYLRTSFSEDQLRLHTEDHMKSQRRITWNIHGHHWTTLYCMVFHMTFISIVIKTKNRQHVTLVKTYHAITFIATESTINGPSFKHCIIPVIEEIGTNWTTIQCFWEREGSFPNFAFPLKSHNRN